MDKTVQNSIKTKKNTIIIQNNAIDFFRIKNIHHLIESDSIYKVLKAFYN